MRAGSATQGFWSHRLIPIRGCGAAIRKPSSADIWGDAAAAATLKLPAQIALPDGDRLVIRNRSPRGGHRPRPTALLVHGLAGSADASYLVRVGRRLFSLGVRVVRVNLRGAGEGFGLARGIYHAGRSDDLREVVNVCSANNPGSPVALIGFSLGANLVLKLAAEASDRAAPRSRLRLGREPADRPGWLCTTDAPTRKSALRLELRALASCDGDRLHSDFPISAPQA